MTQRIRILLAGACLGMAAFAGGPAVVHESRIPADQYAGAYMKWVPNHMRTNSNTLITFVLPSVDIYDASGAIIYHGQKVDNDVGVLENLPKRAQELRASGIHPNLGDALAMVPDLAKQRSSILSNGRYTVVSITRTTHCPKCGVQDDAIARLKKMNPNASINVLEVRLQ